ncbi:MAG: 5-formyltetrahydrofolate cyclo-ligase [Clostridiales bacterium]|nr:5-formyltetrahydrofolate cyclo-ligase [Clostridiales bacterium]
MKDIIKEKNQLRTEMQELRNRLTKEEILDRSSKIKSQLFSLLNKNSYKNYMSYVSVRSEVRTIEIIKELLRDEKKVSVPVCVIETTKLIASQILHMNELVPSHFGLLEPKNDLIRPIKAETLEVVLVPGLAFDRKGNRLGYGKGYYDGFLKRVSPNTLKIGLAYSFQVIKEVPVDFMDVPLDIIITENEIITC